MFVCLRHLLHLALALLLALKGASGNAQEVLTTIRAVRLLTPEQAAANLPVRISGVVTGVSVSNYTLWLQDETDGIYIRGSTTPLDLGDRVVVEGVTRFGKFSPSIGALGEDKVKVTRLSAGPLPPPLPTTLAEAMTGARHDLLVSMSGVIRTVTMERGLRGSNFLLLSISTPQGQLAARVFGADPAHAAEYEAWLNLPAQFVGVMSGSGNERGQLAEVNIVMSSPSAVHTDAAGLEALFSRPPVGFSDLLRYNGSREPSPRIAVRGVVAMVQPGAGVFLVEKDTALWVQTPQATNAQPGDVLAAAGYPISDHDRISLAETIVRNVGRASAPTPLPLSAEEAAQPRPFDAFVAVQGEVIRDAPIPSGRVLTLRNGQRQFVARVLHLEDGDPSTFPAGSLLAVSGILEARPHGAAKEHSFTDFELLARTDADLALLRAAPWLTAPRLRWLIPMLLSGFALAMLWAWLLRRQVWRQTRLIKHQVHQQTLTTERQRMARELHDTLEQQLVGVQIQLNALTYRLPEQSDEVRDAIGHASAMLEHSRNETRRSVWELRSQLLEEGGLPGALRSLLTPLETTSGIRVSLEVCGQERRLECTTELHVLRIAQEAVTNALKHARATQIDVTLDFSSGGLQLLVADNGTGFDPLAEASLHSPHFGLLGMRERAGKLGAKLELHSSPDDGTQIRLTLPPV